MGTGQWRGRTLASLMSWPWASGLYMGSATWHTLRGCSMKSAPSRDISAMPIGCSTQVYIRM